MEMTCNFFHCSEGSIPFTYLDLPVGAFKEIVNLRTFVGAIEK